MDAAGPIPTLTPGEADAASTSYAGRHLTAPPPTAREAGPLAPDKAPTTQASTEPSVGEQILNLLTSGPRSVKELREALPVVTRGTISNRLTALREDGLVQPVSRGVWTLTD
ncbi:winged helix-turn-helix domain-containing protein [Streptomyces sp. ACA25]|uniref:winged helix-turn-helix domain-containing protein n=1 Tax=Streptomyces sp. ACA25 TaxID=3022596 RepID=UPI002307007C|nr:winged helix-turn-helix domain-containing protein [Streptomyces sp. ACA25]MDB1089435.1 winged helix-turn-helix domain-containing protein [Streptomyces sp. ACA25]